MPKLFFLPGHTGRLCFPASIALVSSSQWNVSESVVHHLWTWPTKRPACFPYAFFLSTSYMQLNRVILKVTFWKEQKGRSLNLYLNESWPCTGHQIFYFKWLKDIILLCLNYYIYWGLFVVKTSIILTNYCFRSYVKTFNKISVPNEITKQASKLYTCKCIRNRNEEGEFVRLWLVAAVMIKHCWQTFHYLRLSLFNRQLSCSCAPAVHKTYFEYIMPIIETEHVKILTGV